MKHQDVKLVEKNVYSQFGEDGIVEYFLGKLSHAKTSDGFCVEFGAWDGIHLSNTYNLIKNRDFSGILIEGDKSKVKLLNKNIPSEKVIKLCEFVGFGGGVFLRQHT
jgi:hypothetical protein